jgi:hypothetical protein
VSAVTVKSDLGTFESKSCRRYVVYRRSIAYPQIGWEVQTRTNKRQAALRRFVHDVRFGGSDVVIIDFVEGCVDQRWEGPR